MIKFYNATKGGVERFDQMCSNKSSNRKTSRWPMCVFYGIINVATINSYVILCHNLLLAGRKISPRRDFLKELLFCLVEPWLQAWLLDKMGYNVNANTCKTDVQEAFFPRSNRPKKVKLHHAESQLHHKLQNVNHTFDHKRIHPRYFSLPRTKENCKMKNLREMPL